MAIFQQQPIVTDRPFVARENHSQQFRCKYELELRAGKRVQS